jgi:hypothetical protein
MFIVILLVIIVYRELCQFERSLLPAFVVGSVLDELVNLYGKYIYTLNRIKKIRTQALYQRLPSEASFD